MVIITEAAQQYLANLLTKQEEEDIIGIRMFVEVPGTPRAETCIAYCREQDRSEQDEKIEYPGFAVWFDHRSLPFLAEAEVDYANDQMGGQLTIKAPNAKVPKAGEDSPLEDRINYMLYNEINPALASHGGEVSLVEITEGDVAVLRFGGGCQGCGMVDVTLKDGVERTLMEKLPQLKAIRDVTDHTDRSNAYYR